MKRKIGLGLLGLVVLVGLGCSSAVEPLQPMPRGEEQVVVQESSYEVADRLATTVRDFSDAPEGTWIFPGKVEIGNLYPGARAEETISIHNGGSEASEFLVYYEDLFNETDGYYWAPREASSWMSLSDSSPLIEPGEIVDILVVLEIPADVVVEEEKWGFLIVVSEASQTGMIKVRNASKWLVNMRR